MPDLEFNFESECEFLFESIHDFSVPINKITEHLTSGCQDCRIDFNLVWDEYEEYETANRPKDWPGGTVCNSLKWIHPGLNRNNFLIGWRQGIAKKWEVFELHMAEGTGKIESQKGRDLIRQLFWGMHKAIQMRSCNIPKPILKQSFYILAANYKRLRDFLGPVVFACFIGLDSDNEEAELNGILAEWEEMLGLK